MNNQFSTENHANLGCLVECMKSFSVYVGYLQFTLSVLIHGFMVHPGYVRMQPHHTLILSMLYLCVQGTAWYLFMSVPNFHLLNTVRNGILFLPTQNKPDSTFCLEHMLKRTWIKESTTDRCHGRRCRVVQRNSKKLVETKSLLWKDLSNTTERLNLLYNYCTCYIISSAPSLLSLKIWEG